MVTLLKGINETAEEFSRRQTADRQRLQAEIVRLRRAIGLLLSRDNQLVSQFGRVGEIAQFDSVDQWLEHCQETLDVLEHAAAGKSHSFKGKNRYADRPSPG